MDQNLTVVALVGALLKQFLKEDDKILEWLKTPLAEFNDVTPVELIANGRSEELVLYITKIFSPIS